MIINSLSSLYLITFGVNADILSFIELG